MDEKKQTDVVQRGSAGPSNVDSGVVEDFGREWRSFNQQTLSERELAEAFDAYFRIFPFGLIGKHSVGFDMGCGSGRWAKLVAPRVKELNCIDASDMALGQAKKNLARLDNCKFECASVTDCSLEDSSQDFGYCLGVLHHIPDTQSGLNDCVRKLKPEAPFLLYLYYRFDNRPAWFGLVWRLSDVLRKGISRLPFSIKLFVSQVLALSVYWPMSRLSLLLENLGFDVDNIPLSAYRDKSIYFLRTDALDRFGTRLEKRFTRSEIESMMHNAGLSNVSFSEESPFWVAVGTKA